MKIFGNIRPRTYYQIVFWAFAAFIIISVAWTVYSVVMGIVRVLG